MASVFNKTESTQCKETTIVNVFPYITLFILIRALNSFGDEET
jgi:hypothetical protein